MTLIIENREEKPSRNQQPDSQRCTFQCLVGVFNLCSLGIQTLDLGIQGVSCLLSKVPQYSVKHVIAHSCSHWNEVLNKYIEVCFLLFTTFHRLTTFYLCSIKNLCFILQPAIQLSYNALENSCSWFFLSHVHWKLWECQNCAIFNFQYREYVLLL